MMRCALISSGVVQGVYVADAAWLALNPDAVEVPPGSRVGPGWTYDGSTFSAPPTPPPSVPASVTRRQAKQAMVLSGISMASIDTAIAALPEPQKTLAQIDWQDSNEFVRGNPTLGQLAAALGLTPAQVDDLFRLAATL